MGKQIFNITGMMRDLDPAKFKAQYAYEIRNLRLVMQEDSTMLALVSEKGNLQYTVTGDSIIGAVIGYCTLNDYLVLFTHSSLEIPDRIYRLEMNGMDMASVLLYEGSLGFGEEGVRIEALGVYENEKLQKVYWIDSVHQPRFINIVAGNTSEWNDSSFDFVPSLAMEEEVLVEKASYNGMFNAGTIQYVLAYYNKNGQQTAAFYQSPLHYIAPENSGASPEDTVNNSFRVRVYNPDRNFDYIRVYSVFRSAENGVPVCKKVYDLKTGNVTAETKVFTKFTGVTLGTETSGQYRVIPLGLYSVYVVDADYHEVSIEDFLAYREGKSSVYSINHNYSIFTVSTGSPAEISRMQAVEGSTLNVLVQGPAMIVNRVGNSTIRMWADVTAHILDDERVYEYVEYIDNGLSGEVADYSEVLYSGGANIIPSAMAQKDNTLFFGNYTGTSKISETDKDIIRDNSSIHFGYSSESVGKGAAGSFYMYHNQLDGSAKRITTFKGGETYHFGIILQDAHGIWTDVVPVGKAYNPYYPKDTAVESFYPVKAYISFSKPALDIVSTYKAVKVVRLDTLPSVVCQGVLCPTVFNHSRETNSPYCMSSWFFRDIKPGNDGYDSILASHHVQNFHNGNIREGLGMNPVREAVSEIQGASSDAIGYYDTGTNPDSLTDMDMFVDWNTLTLNSPDIEFWQSPDFNYKMRIVGILPITSGRTSMTLTWSTASHDPVLAGFDYSPIIHNTSDTDAYELDLSSCTYKDRIDNDNGNYIWKYPVYPWHRNGSLTGDAAPEDDEIQYALLDTKVMASLRESALTKYKAGPIYNITKMKTYQDDETLLLLEEDAGNPLFSTQKIYAGSMDTVLTAGQSGYDTYKKRIDTDAIYLDNSGNKEPVRMQYGSTAHGVFSLKSSNGYLYVLPNISVQGNSVISEEGELLQITPVAEIKAKLTPDTVSPDIYNLTIQGYTISGGNIMSAQFNIGDVIMLTNEEYSSRLYYIIHMPDSNTLFVTGLDGSYIENHPKGSRVNLQKSDIQQDDTGQTWTETSYRLYFIYNSQDSVEYYYVNVVETEGEFDEGHNVLEWIKWTEVSGYTHAGDISASGNTTISQQTYDVTAIDSEGYSYMYLAELYTDSPAYNYYNTPWYVASEPVKTGRMSVEASIGDTYYQRYDCLKTYPHSPEDQNQIVEIFSFMCETKANIDGRYDNRRGMADNTSVLGTNFNLLNKAYTQADNLFTYYYLDPDDVYADNFPNQIIWSMTKTYGSDIDAWTKIVATSTLDMDANLGQIRALKLWNDNLICFQDTGIAKVMYNERTALSVEKGVPVVIANSGKVDGSQYISNQVGCTNADSIQMTQEGVYFIDSNTKDIYRLSQNLEPLSKEKGFDTYLQKSVECLNSEKTFYDPKLKDMYFRFSEGGVTECLVYSEQLNEFTSFFDYDMDFMFLFKGSLISVEHNSGNLWKQFASDEYLRYFDETDGEKPVYKDYKIQLVSAENPADDKTFTNVEFRADVLDGSITVPSQAVTPLSSLNKLPFKTIRAWNEYQDTGEEQFYRMFRKGSNISQKFRIWRADIGRDRMDKVRVFNRIRSPWARIQLTGGGGSMKTVIHDIAVNYV